MADPETHMEIDSAAAAAAAAASATADESPIGRLAQDHLFSILLLLPVDSILSFSSTCKKFRCLACSDALWESICQRDWTWTRPIDSLLTLSASSSSSSSRHAPTNWLTIYKQVARLDSVACHSLSGMPLQLQGQPQFPAPRASHSLNFVSDCLVLFGGGCEGGRHLDDTWVAYIGRDFRRNIMWQRVNTGSPSGRFGHTCVAVGDSLVLFGGIDDHGNRQNDTWVAQVAVHDTLGIRLVWRLLEVGCVVPPARGAHAASCVGGKKMVVHGGIGLYGLRLGDTWVLELSDNLCFGMWHEIVANPSPPARSGHTLTCVGGNCTILFGGRGLGYEVLNDLWLLDISGGDTSNTTKWVQLLYELHDIPQGMSLPRVGHSATLVLGGRLLIYGGEDSIRHRKEDFWVLNTKDIKSQVMQGNIQQNSTTKCLLASSWKRLNSKGYKASSRSFHRACADNLGRYVYVFGGMVDGLLQPAASSGLRFDGELFLVEIPLAQL